MSDAVQTTITSAPVKRRGPPAKPFPKGVSPNPGGQLPSQQYRDTVAALTAELGGELTHSQELLVHEIARIKSHRRAQRDPVRAANAVSKMLKQLGATRKREPAKPGIDAYAREHGDA